MGSSKFSWDTWSEVSFMRRLQVHGGWCDKLHLPQFPFQAAQSSCMQEGTGLKLVDCYTLVLLKPLECIWLCSWKGFTLLISCSFLSLQCPVWHRMCKSDEILIFVCLQKGVKQYCNVTVLIAQWHSFFLFAIRITSSIFCHLFDKSHET